MKIAIMGDSISQGIGSKKINYEKFLNENYEVKNYALTGTTTTYALDIINDVINYKPNVVILFYGNVDALPRVKTESFFYKHILPKRYKKLGMLDPRALYSRKKYIKIFQVIDSTFRYKMKNFLINIQGYEQWVNIDRFKKNYEEILNIFNSNNVKVISISNVPISEKYFNKANFEYKKYNKFIKNISNKYCVSYIDLYFILKKYKLEDIFLKDLYHPNEEGYKIIADLINDEIEKYSKK